MFLKIKDLPRQSPWKGTDTQFRQSPWKGTDTQSPGWSSPLAVGSLSSYTVVSPGWGDDRVPMAVQLSAVFGQEQEQEEERERMEHAVQQNGDLRPP